MPTASPALFTDSPFGTTITPEQIIEDIGFFDDWEDRYRYVIDLGKQLVKLPEESRTDDKLILGCQSQVWVHHYRDNGKEWIRTRISSVA